MKKRVTFAVLIIMLLVLMTSAYAQYYDDKGYYHDEYGKIYEPGSSGTVGKGVWSSDSRDILPGGVKTSSDEKKTPLKQILSGIGYIFKLEWLKGNEADKFAATARCLIWITIFVLVFEGLKYGVSQFSRRSRIVISLVVASLGAIFIPPTVLTAIGGVYGAIIALLFLGIPLVLAALLVFAWPDTHRAVVIVKILILTLIVWIFTVLAEYLPSMT